MSLNPYDHLEEKKKTILDLYFHTTNAALYLFESQGNPPKTISPQTTVSPRNTRLLNGIIRQLSANLYCENISHFCKISVQGSNMFLLNILEASRKRISKNNLRKYSLVQSVQKYWKIQVLELQKTEENGLLNKVYGAALAGEIIMNFSSSC